MVEIAPSVLAENMDDYSRDLDKAVSLSSRIQIDLADGDFAPNRTINLVQAYWPDEVKADLHLMYQNPLDYLSTMVAHSPNLAIFHAEASGVNSKELAEVSSQLKALGIKVGLALLPQTTVAEVEEYLDFLDHMLIFTGELGHYGGHMQAHCLDKIEQVKAMRPGIEVGVDGGINDSNAGLVVAKGVDVLNVGSYLQETDDPKNAYAKLEQAIKANA